MLYHRVEKTFLSVFTTLDLESLLATMLLKSNNILTFYRLSTIEIAVLLYFIFQKEKICGNLTHTSTTC